MKIEKKLIYETKQKVIKIYEINHISYKTYSFYVKGICESKGITEQNYKNLKNNLKLSEELSIIENKLLKKEIIENVYLYLNKKINKFSLNGQKNKIIGNEKIIFEINGNFSKNEILTKQMIELFSFLEELKNNYFLIGGTAIALYLGHRESIDYDLFSNNENLSKIQIEKILEKYKGKFKISETSNNNFILSDRICEFSLNGVNMTLMDSSITIRDDIQVVIPVENSFNNFPLKVPTLKVLGASKLIAITNRRKNKDYYDLYFILKKIKIEELLTEMYNIYGYVNNFENLLENLTIENGEKFFEINEKIIWKIPESEIPSISELQNFFINIKEKVELFYINHKEKYINFSNSEFDKDDGFVDILKQIFYKIKK